MTLKVAKARFHLHELPPLQLTVSATVYAFLQQVWYRQSQSLVWEKRTLTSIRCSTIYCFNLFSLCCSFYSSSTFIYQPYSAPEAIPKCCDQSPDFTWINDMLEEQVLYVNPQEEPMYLIDQKSCARADSCAADQQNYHQKTPTSKK